MSEPTGLPPAKPGYGWVSCSLCGGSGKQYDTSLGRDRPCTKCEGRGMVQAPVAAAGDDWVGGA